MSGERAGAERQQQQQSPSVQHAPDQGSGATTPAAATVQRVQDANPRGFNGEELITAVKNGDFDGALRLCAQAPATAFHVLDEGRPVGSQYITYAFVPTTPAFYSMIRSHHPIEGARKALLRQIYYGAPLAHKRQIFQAQYGISITDNTHWFSANESFSEAQLNTLYEQAYVLPVHHVTDNSQFNELHVLGQDDYKKGIAGTHAEQMLFGLTGGNVNVTNQAGGASLANTFRHEVGHAVDAKLGSKGDHFRHQVAGWKDYSASAWIAAMGGLAGVPENLHPIVERAVEWYFGSGGTFNAPTATFAETLEKAVRREGSYAFGLISQTSDSDTQKIMNQLQPLLAQNLVLKACVASQGNANYQRNSQWVNNGKDTFFINHYYGRGFSMHQSTMQHLWSWGDLYAAFSDKEWFAELYTSWYGDPASRAQMPEWIRTYFTNTVDKMGVVQGDAGNNPSVPR